MVPTKTVSFFVNWMHGVKSLCTLLFVKDVKMVDTKIANMARQKAKDTYGKQRLQFWQGKYGKANDGKGGKGGNGE